MVKREYSPWQWQDQRSYVQAVEVTDVKGTLYCSGQAAVYADGKSSTDDMKTQLLLAISNLEEVITGAGYECKNIVRLNVYSTSEKDFFECFGLLQDWISNHGIKQATKVNRLYRFLKH